MLGGGSDTRTDRMVKALAHRGAGPSGFGRHCSPSGTVTWSLRFARTACLLLLVYGGITFTVHYVTNMCKQITNKNLMDEIQGGFASKTGLSR